MTAIADTLQKVREYRKVQHEVVKPLDDEL